MRTLLYEWRRTLLTPILVHVTFNSLFAAAVAAYMYALASAPYLGVVSRPNGGGVVVVKSVAAGSPAEACGLRSGDIITQIGEYGVTTKEELRAALLAHEIGDQVTVRFIRNNARMAVDATLTKRDPNGH